MNAAGWQDGKPCDILDWHQDVCILAPVCSCAVSVQIKKLLGDRLGSLDQNDEDGEPDEESGLIEEAQAEIKHLDLDLNKLAL